MRSAPLAVLLAACQPGGSGAVPGDHTSPPGATLPEGVRVEDGPVVRPHKVLTVDLDAAAGMWVTCQRDDDDREVILVEQHEVAATHRVDLLGLAAGTSYTCTVHVDGSPHTLDFPLDVEAVPEAPAFTVERHPTLEMSGAWTMVNTAGGCFQNDDALVIIADPDGRHRWVYNLGPGYVIDIDASLTPDGNVHMGGGWGLLDENQGNRGVFRTVALDGTTLVDRTEPDFGLGFNHHSEPMDDGSTLSLTTSWMDDGAHQWYGVGVERWHPDQGLVWSWSTQPMVDAGILTWRPGQDNPYHANSVEWLTDQEGDALMVSLYMAQEIWRIDRNTGLRTWRLGPGGDFDLVDPDGNPLPDEEWFYVQHDPEWTPDGRVLLYDNGYQRPGTDYSRVAEYQVDPATRTATLLWSWTEPNFYNPVVGDADRLPNGHVLVAKGFVICWTPGSPDVSAVVEIDPASGEVVWRMSWPDRTMAMFRAERYDGCALFANNTRYCPAAADRLAELASGGI